MVTRQWYGHLKWLLGCLVLFCYGASFPALAIDVLVILDHESEIHQTVLQNLRSTLDPKITRLQTMDQMDELPSAAIMLTMDLIVTIGSQAAHKVLDSVTNKPVLSVLVPKLSYEALINTSSPDGSQQCRSAIYIDQPSERQIALARIIFPQARVAGLMLGPAFSHQSERLRKNAAEFNLQLNLVELTDNDDPATGIKQLISGSEFVLALYDPVVLNPLTAKWLLYMAYQRRLPVIGFSLAYIKAGAVAAVFSTPEQIGRQAGQKVTQWLREGRGQLGESQYPSEYEIAFNKTVAESLKLKLPTVQETRERMARLLRVGD